MVEKASECEYRHANPEIQSYMQRKGIGQGQIFSVIKEWPGTPESGDSLVHESLEENHKNHFVARKQ
jgi:hypothetical protein